MVEKDIDRILIETLKLSRENKELLMKLNKKRVLARNLSILKFAIVLAVLGVILYYGYPYWNQIKATISDVRTATAGLVQAAK